MHDSIKWMHEVLFFMRNNEIVALFLHRGSDFDKAWAHVCLMEIQRFFMCPCIQIILVLLWMRVEDESSNFRTILFFFLRHKLEETVEASFTNACGAQIQSKLNLSLCVWCMYTSVMTFEGTQVWPVRHIGPRPCKMHKCTLACAQH